MPDPNHNQMARMMALARGLADAGVVHACVSPGSRSTPLALALARENRIRCWSQVDERAGGFFGLGIAKATGRPAALLCTSGTAAAEFHPAVIEARHARVPLVVLTADRPAELRDCGAGQAIDQIKLYGDAVKWFFEAEPGGEGTESIRFFRSLGARAAASAAASPPGPVHLNIPLRDPLTPSPEALDRAVAGAGAADPRPLVSHHEGSLVPDPALVRALGACLREEPRGLIVCGEIDGGEEAVDAIRNLSRATGYPILADVLSGLRAPRAMEDAVIDAWDFLLSVDRFAAAHVPRVVIRFGALPTSKPLRAFLASCAGAGDVRHILVDPWGDLRDPLHAATDVLRAGSAPLARALAEVVGPPRVDETGWRASWRGANARARRGLEDALERLDEPFEGRIARDLARALPGGSTLFVGSSMPIRDLDAFFAGAPGRLRILSNRGANGIDGVLSTALGVAAVSDGPAALYTGDLGFLHDLGGLLAARRHGIPLLAVVVNNDGGGIFRFLPQAAHGDRFEDLFATPHGLTFEHAAALFGLDHRAAQGPADFAKTVAEAIERGRATIIEVRTDPKRNVALHAAVRRAAEEALRDG